MVAQVFCGGAGPASSCHPGKLFAALSPCLDGSQIKASANPWVLGPCSSQGEGSTGAVSRGGAYGSDFLFLPCCVGQHCRGDAERQ